ncbi:MAG: hypothetical protein Q8M88_09450 [Phenylobacterium sp.]|uniref:hypothetical protein n=1 Tax=Phenylobacterium sp. TaxID=1871053 RepID=UPI002736CAA2|nr:hypothetical protein [Phenylobacterium sp.]MDP3174644.1 hypothetical protein [Phenylobacterium sp.]
MINDLNSTHPVLTLFQLPTRRQKLARRRRYVVVGVAVLAVASAAVGLASKPHDAVTAASPSYFLSE